MPKHDTVPLSSLEVVPLTDETRHRLLDLGVGEDRIVGLSEMGGQSLLTLHEHVNDDEGAYAPPCFMREFDPIDRLCQGCVYQPRCWRADRGYLAKLADGSVPRPSGVPGHVVDARLAQLDGAPEPEPPPVKAAPKKAPPPPSKSTLAPPSPPAARSVPPPPPKRKAPPPPPRRKG